MSDVRRGVLVEIAGMIVAPPAPGCVRVGIDGVDGVGKSTFARELATAVLALGRPAVNVSADDFHHPSAVRHRLGRDSPEGFWLDSYDLPALISNVLQPFGPGGSRRYRPAVPDLATDQRLDLPWQAAPQHSVLVVDGLFLHRDELVEYWDFSVFLHAPVQTTVARMARRDGTHPDPAHPSLARYIGGQRRYFAACAPWRRANIVIDNTDLNRPSVLGPGWSP